MTHTLFRSLGLVATSLIALPVFAAISESDSARLGRDLTPLGGERAGNADRSIP